MAPRPLELAPLLAIDSAMARRVICGCWRRTRMIRFDAHDLEASGESNLTRFLDSLSWTRGPNQMLFHRAAMGQAGVFLDDIVWRAPFSPPGLVPPGRAGQHGGHRPAGQPGNRDPHLYRRLPDAPRARRTQPDLAVPGMFELPGSLTHAGELTPLPAAAAAR
jgi:hypothetical protein